MCGDERYVRGTCVVVESKWWRGRWLSVDQMCGCARQLCGGEKQEYGGERHFCSGERCVYSGERKVSCSKGANVWWERQVCGGEGQVSYNERR